MARKYLSRIADKLLEEALQASSAVQVKGPKWCGKTETSLRHAKSALFMQDPDNSKNYLALADSKPSLLLEGDEPRLIDEWEMAPQLWDAVRYSVDRNNAKARFILTGSSVPKVKPAHSGVGRIARFEMRTMSLWESLESTGEVSLLGLFGGAHEIAALSDTGIEEYAFFLCRGGWPAAVTDDDKKIALKQAGLYISELLDANLSEIDEIRRNPSIMKAIMRSYARHISSQASLSTIMGDIAGVSPSDVTVADYLDVLRRAYIIEDLPAWNPRLRSKVAVRTSPTRHYVDPSLAAALLNATPDSLMFDLETFGLLFESLCVRDLRCYAEAIGGKVFHYRDKSGLEVDAIVVLEDGRWGAIEVKLGQSQIDEAAKHLKLLENKIDSAAIKEPSFLLVLTATTAAFHREDGVLVAPLACLAP